MRHHYFLTPSHGVWVELITLPVHPWLKAPQLEHSKVPQLEYPALVDMWDALKPPTSLLLDSGTQDQPCYYACD